MTVNQFFINYFRSHENAQYIHTEEGDKFAVVFEHDESKVRSDIIQALKNIRKENEENFNISSLVFETMPVETGIRIRW